MTEISPPMKTEEIEIHDKVYELATYKGEPLHKNDMLYVMINGQRTHNKFSDLFLKSELEPSIIRGYSILENWEIREGKMENNGKQVHFVSHLTGEEVFLKQIKDPWWIWNDKKVTAEYIKKTVGIIHQFDIPTAAPAPSPVLPILPPPPIIMDPLPPPPPPVKPSVLNEERNSPGDEFLEERKYVEMQGYGMHEYGNYRIFHKGGSPLILIYIDKKDFYKVPTKRVNNKIGEWNFSYKRKDYLLSFNGAEYIEIIEIDA